MRPVSESTARIARHNFSKKFVAIGRIVEHWDDIMGNEFADKAQPIKLNYRKGVKGKKATATLDIATTSSFATTLPYQKGLILERINRIFGDQWITDIKFVASELSETPITPKKRNTPLTGSEKNYLSSVLGNVEDPDIKERLERLGKSIITERKQ
jgi:hypothetical protein